MLKSMIMIGVACFFGGTINAEEAVKLKTSKEIPASIFGTQTHFGQWWKYKKVLPLVEKAGLKWIRDEVYWGRVEKKKGVLKIPANAQAWIDDANARGINVMIPLNYGNKFYPLKDVEVFKDGYVNYCKFMAKSLKGKVKVWEIWNEPHLIGGIKKTYGGAWNGKPESPWIDKFADLAIAAAKAIKSVDPDAVIITGGGNPPATHYLLDAFKQKKGAELFDGVTLHPYPFKLPPEVLAYGGKVIEKRDGISVADDDHTYSSLVRRLKEKMISAGMKNTNIYVTEFGFTTFHRSEDKIYMGSSPATQAKYLSRMFLLHLVNGIKVAIQYDFQNDGTKLKNAEHNFGLVKAPAKNYEPKPSYYAIQRMCALFSEPIKLFKEGFAVTATPDRYLDSKNWKYIEPSMVWDGQEIQSLNRVEKYLFKNSKTSEVMLVLWNAVRASDRQDLLSDLTLATSAYKIFSGIDIMTGKNFKLNATVKAGKTILKNVIIPDYPIVIKMFKKK